MRSFLVALVAVASALALGALALWAAGVPPLEAYAGMAASCWGRQADTAAKTLVLVLLGTGVSFAFRAGFWNVGAEGQLCAGAVAAAGIALLAPVQSGPAGLWTALALTAGAAAGAAWCVFPAVLRARWGASEVVTTLMLVYVAKRLMEYLYLGPWKDPQGYGFPGTAPVPDALRVGVPALLAAGVAAAVVAGLLLDRSVLGHEMGVLGESWDVAAYAGIGIGRTLCAAAAASGALAGLAGAAQVLGTAGRLISGISVGDGFTAIIVACLASRQPLGVLVAAPVWAVLKVGVQDLELSYRIPQAFSTALEGLCLLCWLAAVSALRRVAAVRGSSPTPDGAGGGG